MSDAHAADVPAITAARSWTEVIVDQGSRIPDVTALTDEHGARLTYGELETQVRQAAAFWTAQGVGAGDRVAVLGHNSIELAINVFGLSWIGATPVMLNWRLTPAELKVLGEACAVMAIAHDEEFGASAAAVVPDGPRLTMLGRTVTGEPTTAMARARNGNALAGEPQVTETFVILHTSGTTGLPRLVPLSQSAHMEGCGQMASLAGLAQGDVHLRFTPLFHLAGLQELCFAILTGGHTHLMARFDPEMWLDSVAVRHVRFGHLPPAAMRRVVECYEDRPSKPDLSSLDEVWYGTAPASPELVSRALAAFGCGLRQIYGMTEAQSPVAILMPEDHWLDPGRLASAGKIRPGWEWRLVDPSSGLEVGAGGPGELHIRGPRLFSGYWSVGCAPGVGLDEDGWYATGDVVTVDEDGYLTVVDRAKDMIVSGGENVYPAEVELVLASHPGIEEVSVIGVPSEQWGESVHAVIVPRADDFDAEAFLTWARERLAGFKVPRSMDVVHRLPRNASGKVLKRELRAQYWSAQTRGVS